MFRFTIRELLILTVTAGLAVGWWIDHRQLNERVTFLEGGAKEVLELQDIVVEIQGKRWPGTQ